MERRRRNKIREELILNQWIKGIEENFAFRFSMNEQSVHLVSCGHFLAFVLTFVGYFGHFDLFPIISFISHLYFFGKYLVKTQVMETAKSARSFSEIHAHI